MADKILVAGGTGNLGGRIVHALLDRGAQVRMIIRKESSAKALPLQQKGVELIEVELSDKKGLAKACGGISCVVSALQGLRDVIVDGQSALLDAAITAGVRHFIPSDYSLDFTRIESENRNFDLRREFHQKLEASSIAFTSIFNGAFAEILGYGIPILDFRKKTAGYWGDDPDFHLDYTTMDDTAAFTATTAMDHSAPPKGNIAGFQVSPNELVQIASSLTNTKYQLVHMGSLEEFAAYNKQQRKAQPDGEKELNPRWQSGQYMHDQFSVHHESLDNDRYPGINWTGAEAFLKKILVKS